MCISGKYNIVLMAVRVGLIKTYIESREPYVQGMYNTCISVLCPRNKWIYKKKSKDFFSKQCARYAL
jgi:hypothetical protein